LSDLAQVGRDAECPQDVMATDYTRSGSPTVTLLSSRTVPLSLKDPTSARVSDCALRCRSICRQGCTPTRGKLQWATHSSDRQAGRKWSPSNARNAADAVPRKTKEATTRPASAATAPVKSKPANPLHTLYTRPSDAYCVRRICPDALADRTTYRQQLLRSGRLDRCRWRADLRLPPDDALLR
jgi:hypothetical protein